MGLREIKKERTHKAIEDAAIKLFAERGFHATTVADIAEAADISPRTFFSYFPSKEDVLFADAEPTFAELERVLRERPAGQTTFETLHAWITDLMDELGKPKDRDRLIRHLIESDEALRARERAVMARFEGLLAEAIAADLGDDPDAMRPQMVAAAAVAALWCMRDVDAEEDEDVGHERSMERLAEAMAFLRAGTTALLPQSPASG
jgi:AcrR family transcriptional regulator